MKCLSKVSMKPSLVSSTFPILTSGIVGKQIESGDIDVKKILMRFPNESDLHDIKSN